MALRCGVAHTLAPYSTQRSLRLTSPQRSRPSVPKWAAPLRSLGEGRRCRGGTRHRTERDHRRAAGPSAKPTAPPPPPQVRATGRRPTTAASAHCGSRTMSRTTSARSPTRPGRVGGGGSAGQRARPSKSADRGTHTTPDPPKSPMMTPWTPTWSKVPRDNKDALVFGAELDSWERALMGL